MRKPEHDDPMLMFQATAQALQVGRYFRQMDDSDWEAVIAFLDARSVNLVSDEASAELVQMDETTMERWIREHDEVGFAFTLALVKEFRAMAERIRELWAKREQDDLAVMAKYKTVN